MTQTEYDQELKAAKATSLRWGLRVTHLELELMTLRDERNFDALIMKLALERMTSKLFTGEWIAPEVVMENLTARLENIKLANAQAQGGAYDDPNKLETAADTKP